ncbi:hypothetical protein K3495_g3390 [Podosphaera aphanis]|nr:hypothetical protein K3495_g3390 [Podosphaera aphanis]
MVSSGLVSSSYPTLYSSRSKTPPAALAEDGSRASSPAFSTTSTVEEEATSPVIPPLPEPTFNGHVVNLSTRTPPLSSVADQTSYYTASWGSPYQKSPSPCQSEYGDFSSPVSEDSSTHQLEFHTPYLRPAPNLSHIPSDSDHLSQEGLVSAAILANRARRGNTGLTEDWIRKHTEASTAERNHWLSDGELSENSSPSDSLLGSSSPPASEEHDPQTPTLKTYLESLKFENSDKGHKRHQTAATLRQEDFFSESEVSSRLESLNKVEIHLQSKMSPRPQTPTLKETPSESLSPTIMSSATSPTVTNVNIVPRTKKKIPWRGKNILVLLPIECDPEKNGRAVFPLTRKEVQQMLNEWEKLGYDTQGFNLAPKAVSHDDVAQGQSRATWPSLREILAERSQGSFKVNIPNKKGVSIGGEEPTSVISPNHSRSTPNPYPPLPFSPPIPTSSTGSSHIHQIPFPPVTMSGTSLLSKQNSTPGTITSPLSINAPNPGKFNPRQSISYSSTPLEHPFGSPFQFPQQKSPALWSQGQIVHQQGAAIRGRSPSLQNFGALVSPALPFTQDGYFAQNLEMSLQLQQRQNLMQTHSVQHSLQLAANRSSPRLQKVKEHVEEYDNSGNNNTSITQEAGQVKHNASTSLQEEIDAAEYHLEGQIQRELEHEDYSPHFGKGDSIHSTERPSTHIRGVSAVTHGLATSNYAVDHKEDSPILHHPQPHSRGHSLSQRSLQDREVSTGIQNNHQTSVAAVKSSVSDNDLSKSQNSTSHRHAMSMSLNPWSSKKLEQNISGHVSRMSTSKLNVAAKEFTFNASVKFTPPNIFPSPMVSRPQGLSDSRKMFPSHRNQFNPQIVAHSSPAPPIPANSRSFHNQGTGSLGYSNFKTTPTYNSSSSEFIFPTVASDLGPNLLATAHATLPSTSVPNLNNISHPPIFDNIDFTGLRATRPSRKSKAIPIIRPDKLEPDKQENETIEGSDGRITRGEGQFKRARGSKDDGDSVSQFTEPTPLRETNRTKSNENKSKPEQIDTADTADKENLLPNTNEKLTSPSFEPQLGNFNAKSEEKTEKTFDARQDSIFNDESSLKNEGINQRSNEELPMENNTVNYNYHEVHESSFPSEAKSFGRKSSSTSIKNLSSQTANVITSSPGQTKHRVSSMSIQTFPHPVLSSLPNLVGLSGSRFARSPTPTEKLEEYNGTSSHSSNKTVDSRTGVTSMTQSQPISPDMHVKTNFFDENKEELIEREPTFEEIDAVICQINKNEHAQATYNLETKTQANLNSNVRCIKVPDLDSSSPIRLLPQDEIRSNAPSPSPRRFQAVPGENNIFTRAAQQNLPIIDSGILHNSEAAERLVLSDWDDMLTDGEEEKLPPRAQFFDNHVNSLVGGILADRLGPLERTLEAMQVSIDAMATHTFSNHRDYRGFSGAVSDADDEDEEDPRQLPSSRSERKFDRIKVIIQEALASSNISRTQPEVTQSRVPNFKNVLDVLDELKENISQKRRDSFGPDEIKQIISDAVEERITTSKISFQDRDNVGSESEHIGKILSLEEKLLQANKENKNRIVEFEDKLRHSESKIDEEITNRRAAEDRLSEIQRQLRISSEEELQLRNAIEQKEAKIRAILDENETKSKLSEIERTKSAMRISILEAAQAHAFKNEIDLQTKLRAVESDLQTSRLESHRRQIDTESALETARRHSEDAEQAIETNKELRRKLDKLRIQMEESTRVRETMRGKLIGLQEDMARAAREITEESARRAKKEQELIARHEVLDARLHAEGCTRERLEVEIQRLEKGERDGLRAVGECRKLESLVADLREECHIAKKDAMRYQREFEEARESGLSEVQRTRNYMQADIEAANNQVNIVREKLEHQISLLQADIDQVKLEADTARERSEMLIEEAEMTKKSLISKHDIKLADTVEELQTKHQRQLHNTIEDAQRQEQHLLDRLSLSSLKTEHLQDRVSYLEEKLEIANATAAAAVKAAKSIRSKFSETLQIRSPLPQSNSPGPGTDLPEKISPQALRESIMSLQKQLQERESTIESLTSSIASYDPDATSKIAKRDHEIMWLRELLAVRKSDLSDIVQSLEEEQWDVDRIKDAAIRLRTNLQMQEQELERAINGGSVFNIPNIAASLRDVASPRVVQAVGPLAAAWGNWRKGKTETVAVLDHSSSNTPPPKNSGILGALLTPPVSNIRSKSLSSQPSDTHSSSVKGQRFTFEQLANRPRVPTRGMPPKKVGLIREPESKTGILNGDFAPDTPPIMSKGNYDQDAIEEEFSDAGFYNEDSGQDEISTLESELKI